MRRLKIYSVLCPTITLSLNASAGLTNVAGEVDRTDIAITAREQRGAHTVTIQADYDANTRLPGMSFHHARQ